MNVTFYSLCLTFYSIATAVFWTTVFVLLFSFFRKRVKEFQYVSVYSLLMILFFCILRAVVLVEMPYTYILNSYKILPRIQSFSSVQLFQCEFFTVTPLFLSVSVWLFGAAAVLLKRISGAFRFRRFLNQLPPVKDKNLYRMLQSADSDNKLKNAKIIVHAAAVSPAVFGCFRPVIILPDIHFDDDGLYGIFLHECAHFKYHHVLIKLAAELVCSCFWWNPFFKVLQSETAHALEMHADRAVCQRLDKEQQLKYLASILKVFQNACSADMGQPFACSLAEKCDGTNLSQRFQMILQGRYQKKTKFQWRIALLAVTVFLLTYAVIPQPYSMPAAGDIGYAEYDSCTDYYLIETDNGYDLYEYPDCYIYHLNEMQDGLRWIEIYKNKNEVYKNE